MEIKIDVSLCSGSWWSLENPSCFWQPIGEMPALVKASHLSKAFQCVGTFTHGRDSMVMRRVKSTQLHAWRRKFVKSDTHKHSQTLQTWVVTLWAVTQLQSYLYPIPVRFIISFWRELYAICICLLQLGSMCVQHNTHDTCTQLKMGTTIKMLQLLVLQHSVATLWKNVLNVRNYFLYPQLSTNTFYICNCLQIKTKLIQIKLFSIVIFPKTVFNSRKMKHGIR